MSRPISRHATFAAVQTLAHAAVTVLCVAQIAHTGAQPLSVAVNKTKNTALRIALVFAGIKNGGVLKIRTTGATTTPRIASGRLPAHLLERFCGGH